MFKQVYNHLHKNKLLTKHQSGFRPNDSTTNQLSYLYHEFCNALDAKKDVRIVFCDISKAFDKFGIKVYCTNYVKLVSREIYYCGLKIT